MIKCKELCFLIMHLSEFRKMTNFQNSVLQVLVPAAGIRGFLDASEYGTWLKHFQSISQGDEESKQNVKHFLLAGQVS